MVPVADDEAFVLNDYVAAESLEPDEQDLRIAVVTR